MGVAEAIVNEGKDGKQEVRCAICGKLLFVVQNFSEKTVDNPTPNVIIVARCTRSSCKTDNIFSIKNSL